METTYVLYNLGAGHETSLDDIKKLDRAASGKLTYKDIRSIDSYADFFASLTDRDRIILCGGDGTLNRFVNDSNGADCPCEILYYPFGTGNDFATDVGHAKGCEPFSISEYLKDLPTVTVNGKSYRFVNGVGYGIDGYCCQVGEEQKKDSGKKVNYTSIAIKGLLFHYKPTGATVTVDGVEHAYQKVWLAPTMHGRYYGGGMIPTPDQSRSSSKHLSTMIFYGSGKLKTLMVFPSIFKGEHVKHTKMVEVLTGHEITVTFDRPTALQIDGETILGVTSYTAMSPVKAAAR